MPLQEEIKKDVSIIIVNWNTKDLLLSCIRSVITETKEVSLEIIVVDNASADGSQEALKKEFPEVILIQNEENLGFAKASNIGIKKCIGEYICLINSDIKLLDKCIERMLQYMEQHTSVGLIGPATVNEDLSIRLNCREFPTLWKCFVENLYLHKLLPNIRLFRSRTLDISVYNSEFEAECISGCFLMARSKALDEVGLLDEDFFFYGEDVDWCMRYNKAGWRVILYPKAKAIHYGGGSSKIYPVRFQIEMEKAGIKYWQKHHSRIEQVLYIILRFSNLIISCIGWSCVYILKPTDRKKIERIKGIFGRCKWLIFRNKYEY